MNEEIQLLVLVVTLSITIWFTLRWGPTISFMEFPQELLDELDDIGKKKEIKMQARIRVTENPFELIPSEEQCLHIDQVRLLRRKGIADEIIAQMTQRDADKAIASIIHASN
ncbi:hypothetical protein LCGC14_1389380 [marine sediment metagenome]|uniref:Uncharacterized protein n=1 Tax=marine sediment metagenome TaxID=412755 RepID=A0A0F9K0L6_9ZZZZ